MGPRSPLRKFAALVDEDPYPLYDFTSSGMTHNNAAYAEVHNRNRVGEASTEENFCAVEIDWQAQPAPSISLAAIGSNGAVAFEHRVSIRELRSK